MSSFGTVPMVGDVSTHGGGTESSRLSMPDGDDTERGGGAARTATLAVVEGDVCGESAASRAPSCASRSQRAASAVGGGDGSPAAVETTHDRSRSSSEHHILITHNYCSRTPDNSR